MGNIEEDGERELDELEESSQDPNYAGELREQAEYLSNTSPSIIKDDVLIELEYLLKDVRNHLPRNTELRKRVGLVLSVVSYLCDINRRVPKESPRPKEYFEEISSIPDELVAIAELVEMGL